jgi:DNA-binding CsgD family transcriptional regulator
VSRVEVVEGAEGKLGSVGALVEREEEERAVEAVLDSARSGIGALLVVEGPAGIGKSALAAEARARASERAMDVLAARGVELERDFAFGACLQLFERRIARETGAVRDHLLAGAAGLSRSLFSDEVAVDNGPDRVFALVHGLFWLCSNLAEKAPLLLVVDDAHWVDASSLRFLLYLSERLAELPVTALMTLRPAEPNTPQDLLGALRAAATARVVRPAPLTETAVGTLVRDRWPTADEHFVRACTHVTAGNPFYLHELLHALDAEGIEPSAASVDSVATFAPETVLRSVLARLARFPTSAANLARAVAVLGGDAQLRHAGALAQLAVADAARAADELVAADILRGGDPLSFVHPLVHSAVYAEIPPGERGLLHGRAAHIVADELPAEIAASHLLLAPTTGDAWAVDVLREAARKELATGGAESAARFLRRALAEPPAPEVHPVLLVELAQAEAISGTAADEPTQHLEQALALMDDPHQRAETMLQLGWMLQKAGRFGPAAETFARGLAETKGATDDLATLLEVGWLGAAWLDRTRAQEVLDRRRLLLKRRSAMGKEAERALLAQESVFELFSSESHERVIERATELLDGGALIDEEGSDSLNVWTAIGNLSWADALDAAEEAVEWALADAARRGAFFNAAMAYCMRAWTRYWRGRLADAAADARVALDASRGGWSMILPVAAFWLGLAHIELDDLDAAQTALELPEEDWWTSTLMHGAVLSGRGRLALARAQPELALREFLAAGQIIVGTFSLDNPSALPWRSDAALAAAQLGDTAQARELVKQDVAAAQRFGAPRAIGISLRAAGLIEGGERGADLLREAVAVLETSPSKLELARALIDLGATLRRAGKRTAAREPLRRGLAMVERFGAFRLERQARDELAATGAHLRHRTLSGRDALTPSERRVAEMAAVGMSNRNIAQSLFVTVNAVKWHLRNSYGKLEITSRQELRDALENGARSRPTKN